MIIIITIIIIVVVVSWGHLPIVMTPQRAGRSGIKFVLHAINLSLFPQPTDRNWGPPILLFNGYKGFFPRSKAAGA